MSLKRLCYYNGRNIQLKHWENEVWAYLVKCLPGRNDDVGVISKTHVKRAKHGGGAYLQSLYLEMLET